MKYEITDLIWSTLGLKLDLILEVGVAAGRCHDVIGSGEHRLGNLKTSKNGILRM